MHVHGPDPSTWHWWLILSMPAAGNTNLAWKEPVFLALAEKIKERGRGMLLQRNLPGLGVFMFHEIHVSFSLLPNPCLAVIASKNSLHWVWTANHSSVRVLPGHDRLLSQHCSVHFQCASETGEFIIRQEEALFNCSALAVTCACTSAVLTGANTSSNMN